MMQARCDLRKQIRLFLSSTIACSDDTSLALLELDQNSPNQSQPSSLIQCQSNQQLPRGNKNWSKPMSASILEWKMQPTNHPPWVWPHSYLTLMGARA